MNLSHCIVMAAVASTSLVFAATAAHAEDWEYVPEIGGALDHETGLVWAPLASTWGGGTNVNWATANGASTELAEVSGIGGWRLPTLAETQTAISHNGWVYFNDAWGEGDPACWTATAQGKNYWAVKFQSGAQATLSVKSGLADFRMVREVESWTYRPDLGGWLDNQSGLVWGESSRVWRGQLGYSWAAAAKFGTVEYQELTGIPHWRLPTLAEAQQAFAHNAYAYFSQLGDTSMAPMWTADVKGPSAWAFWYSTGRSMLAKKDSGLPFRLVYRP